MTNLTEKYKQKQLKWYQEYYVDLENNGDIKKLYLEDDWCFYDGIVDHDLKHNPYMVVYDKVPSYEECQKLLSDQLAKIEGEEINAELEAENAKLKELLKECREYMQDIQGQIEEDEYTMARNTAKLVKTKIDEVLK